MNPHGFFARCLGEGLFDLTLREKYELDLARTFAPKPVCLSLLLKVGFFASSITFLVMDLKDYEPRPFWLAYLSNWAAIAAIAYQLCAIVSCIIIMRQADGQPTRPSVLIKATWALYPMAATAELLVTILYWLLDYPGGAIFYVQIFRHGILCVLVIFDGLLYSRIPLRWKQFLFPYLYIVSWIIWSVIHAFLTDIGNPREEDNDPDTDDDSLYPVLNWRERRGQALFWALVSSHAILPILFSILFGLGKLMGSRSKHSGGRTLGDDVDDDSQDDDYRYDEEATNRSSPFSSFLATLFGSCSG